MGYIMRLRKKIGHEELLTAGTGVFPVRGGKVLLQRRADNGLWTMHGGAIEIGEVPEDAAKREFFEETGLRANALELIGVVHQSGWDYAGRLRTASECERDQPLWPDAAG